MGNPVLSNLILLGLAVRRQALFCDAAQCEKAVRTLAPEPFLDQNLAAFRRGLED
jgi:indolepyruvate ferredoxin oxidoreductase beta subunit